MENIIGAIDLHVHSKMSDGTDAPAAIIEKAAAKGLYGVSLTDHDTVIGLAEAEAAAQKYGIRFLPGIELTLNFRGRRIHAVAYGFDRHSAAFKEFYAKVRRNKEHGMDGVIDFIKRRGLPITRAAVEKNITGAFDVYAVVRTVVPFFPGVRVQNIWNEYIYPAFDELGLNRDVSPSEAIDAVHRAGGILSLAHFHKTIGFKGMDWREKDEAVAALKDLGLDGMEKYYPTYTEEDAAFAAKMIEKYGLVPTGGSDYHGLNRPRTELGSDIDGNLAVPGAIIDKIIALTSPR